MNGQACVVASACFQCMSTGQSCTHALPECSALLTFTFTYMSVVVSHCHALHLASSANGAARQVLGLEGRVLRQVACGWRHTVVVDVDGAVFTFGWSKYGQLGHGDCQCAPPRPRRTE